MKLFTCYTPSHNVFVKQFFDSLDQEGLDVIVKEHEQECPTGEFASSGWNITTKRKFEFLLENMEKMEVDEQFIFSDIDVQFFDKPQKFCNKALEYNDIVFQNDYYGHACTGFFYAKNNERVVKLLSTACDTIIRYRDDQDAVNHILMLYPEIKYSLLPPEFFTFGMFYNHWQGEKDFPIPDKIIMHHANWVKGVDKKLELLQTVRDIYNKR